VRRVGSTLLRRGRTGRRAYVAALLLCTLGGGVVASAVADAAATKSRTLSASGLLKRTKKTGNVSAIQQGTIRGAPFGAATMVLRSSLKQATVTSTFTVTTSAGRVTGRATARLTIDGDTSTYKGKATITGGTRRYKRIAGTNIAFTGKGPVSAKTTNITLTGVVRY
jgi:hypothetical protein